jgi:hypothetical protein
MPSSAQNHSLLLRLLCAMPIGLQPHEYWKPKTKDELVTALLKQMQRSFTHCPGFKAHAWSLTFIRVASAPPQIDVGLSRKVRTVCQVSFRYNPDTSALPGEEVLQNDSGPYVMRERDVKRSGPSACIAGFNMPTAFTPVDCDMEARAQLRKLLVEDGVKLVPHPDNAELD